MRNRYLLTAAVSLAFACVVLFTGCGKDLADDPLYAVDQFILDTAISSDGVEACRYLTPAEQHAASKARGDIDCGQALDEGNLKIGGEWISTAAELHALHSKTVVNGDRARVRLLRGKSVIDFELVRADSAEQDEFDPPDTEWRIAKGALNVLR